MRHATPAICFTSNVLFEVESSACVYSESECGLVCARRYSFSERARTFLQEQVRQKLVRGDGSSADDEKRVREAFVQIEDIARHRRFLGVLQLDDTSDDFIDKRLIEMFVIPYVEHEGVDVKTSGPATSYSSSYLVDYRANLLYC